MKETAVCRRHACEVGAAGRGNRPGSTSQPGPPSTRWSSAVEGADTGSASSRMETRYTLNQIHSDTHKHPSTLFKTLPGVPPAHPPDRIVEGADEGQQNGNHHEGQQQVVPRPGVVGRRHVHRQRHCAAGGDVGSAGSSSRLGAAA